MSLKYDDIKDFSPEAQRQIIHKLVMEGREDKLRQPSKYHAEKETRGEIKFDSRKEARYFDELMIRARAGEIRDLKLQPEFTLQEAYTTPEGKKVKAIRYRADFSFERRTKPDTYGYEHWVLEVVDVKGFKTDIYKMKRKMFLNKYGFAIKEV